MVIVVPLVEMVVLDQEVHKEKRETKDHLEQLYENT